MLNQLPSEIERSRQTGGVRYRFPARRVGRYRVIGYIILVLGLGLCVAPFVPAWRLVWLIQQQPVPPEAFLWLGGMMVGLAIFAGGFLLAQLGLFIVAGHSEIEIRDRLLIVTERCGLCRWRWRLPMAGMRRVFVSQLGEPWATFGSWVDGHQPAGLGVIVPEWRPTVGAATSRPVWLAPGYPRSWLTPLAHELAALCPVEPMPPTGVIAVEVNTAGVAVLEQAVGQSDWEELAVQPAGSKITVESADHGLVIHVPPEPGYQNGWFVFGAVLCALALCAGLGNDDARGQDQLRWLAAGMGVVGCCCLVVARWHARNSGVALAVVDGKLILEQGSLLAGRERLEWRQEQLADVFVRHATDSEGPDHFVLEILPDPAIGEPRRLLGKLDVAELRWVATMLRQRLSCPGHPRYSPAAGLVVCTTPHHLPGE